MNFAPNNEILPLPKGILQPFAYYGVHSEYRMNERLYTFRLYMPTADSVSLVSGFSSWETGKKMLRLANGVWELTYATDRSLEGECYKYRCLINGEILYLTDPFATAEEGRGGGASVIATEITRATPMKQVRGEAPCHLLEVSLASFMTRDNRLPYEDGGACRYRELAEKLVIYAKSTGYTHLKLLCREKNEATSLFAPASRYGTPDDFAAFVNILHSNGMRLLVSFYYPETDRDTELTLSAAAWFLLQYAVDGVYFEDNGVKALPSLFSEGLSKLAFRYPDALFTGDCHCDASFSQSRQTTREEAMSSLFTLPFEKRGEALSALLSAVSQDGAYASQSKALTRGGDSSLMSSFYGSYEQKFAANRLYQLLLIAAKGMKLSFMMQSLAPFRPWNDELLPEWYMADFKLHRAHRRYIRALNRLHLETPLLYCSDTEVSVSFVDTERLIFVLKLSSGEGELLVAANASDQHAAQYPITVEASSYTELFSSDEESFAGEGYVHRMTLEAHHGAIRLDLAPLSAVIVQPRLS